MHQGAVGGRWLARWQVNKRKKHVPVLGVAVLVDVNLYTLSATDVVWLRAGLELGLLVAVLLVDVDFLAVLVLLGAALLAVLEDSDVLGVGLAVLRRALSRLIDAD